MTSLYEKLGGEGAFRLLVEDFYRRVLADASLSPYFSGLDIQRIQAHQQAFLIQALGGPHQYSGREMQVAHIRLRVSKQDFYATTDHLLDTLHAAGVDEAIIGEVMDQIEPLRPFIVQP